VRKKHVPMRRCVACGAQRPKGELVRIVRSVEGTLDVDARPKDPGRGAYVCRASACLTRASQGRSVARSLGKALSDDGAERLRALAREQEGASADSEVGPLTSDVRP
jgi:predicted RNA-binding protein YlxR (DUF448 family)